MWFWTSVPNFSSLAWVEVCQEPPVLEVILGGHWRFLTGDLEDGVIPDIMYSDMWFPTCVPNFSSLVWIVGCQEPPVLEVILGGRWWFLTGDMEDIAVPDVMNDVFFHPKEDTLKFCVDSSIRSVSGRGGSRRGNLEDVEGSWQETLRMGLSLMSYIILIDHFEVILKVSWRSDFIWLR